MSKINQDKPDRLVQTVDSIINGAQFVLNFPAFIVIFVLFWMPYKKYANPKSDAELLLQAIAATMAWLYGGLFLVIKIYPIQ